MMILSAGKKNSSGRSTNNIGGASGDAHEEHLNKTDLSRTISAYIGNGVA